MKITFCTTCMGYTKYLKQTYLQNLEVAKDNKYDFVLVNYNSQDDMEDWVQTNLKDHIKTGKVQYYKTDEPKIFNMSQAKNTAHKQGTGDYLINLDADNYLTKEFLSWVDDLISSGVPFTTRGWHHGFGGRVVVKREDFEAVGGYDEKFDVNGDHQDFTRRVKKLGRKIIPVVEEDCLYIDQTDEERQVNLPRTLGEEKLLKFHKNMDNKNVVKIESDKNINVWN